MTAERQYKVSCDSPNCRDWNVVKVSTLKEARRQLRIGSGWESRTIVWHDGTSVMRDYCPRHRRASLR